MAEHQAGATVGLHVTKPRRETFSAPRNSTARESCGMGRKGMSFLFESGLGVCEAGPCTGNWLLVQRQSPERPGYR